MSSENIRTLAVGKDNSFDFYRKSLNLPPSSTDTTTPLLFILTRTGLSCSFVSGKVLHSFSALYFAIRVQVQLYS